VIRNLYLTEICFDVLCGALMFGSQERLTRHYARSTVIAGQCQSVHNHHVDDVVLRE